MRPVSLLTNEGLTVNTIETVDKYWRKPLDEGQAMTPRYRVEVKKELCKGCRFCIELCPRQTLRDSAVLNAKGYRPASAEDTSSCAGCGLCEMVCPDFVIRVTPEDQEVQA